MLLQRRDASAPRLSRTAARLPKALDPDNRRAGTDIKLLGRRAPRRPAFNFRKHSRPHVFRISPRHRPASQNRINADRLSHPLPRENLPDSIGTEHALGSAPVVRLLLAASRPHLGYGRIGGVIPHPVMASVIEVNIEVALRERDEVAVAEPFRIIQHRDDLRRDA